MMRSLIAAAAVGLAAGPALAETQCDTVERIVAVLTDGYGESLRSVGFAGGSEIVMGLYVSDKTGTWTITMALPNGQMCLIASGTGYVSIPQGEPT